MNRLHPNWLEIITDPVRLDVLFALSPTGAGSVSQIARRCHASERTVRRHLDALVALGFVRESPPDRGSERPGRPPTRFILDGLVRDRVMALFDLLSQPLAPWS
jgi:predicted ArsR family transcriptional regulator